MLLLWHDGRDALRWRKVVTDINGFSMLFASTAAILPKGPHALLGGRPKGALKRL
jgi:hypothetical protein